MTVNLLESSHYTRNKIADNYHLDTILPRATTGS